MTARKPIDPVESTLDFLSESLQPQLIPMTGSYITDSIGDDYQSWKRGNPVFIDAPTGTRKTTFIYEKIIPHAISNGQNVLLISNRIALSLQQKGQILSIIRKEVPDSIADIPTDLSVDMIEEYTYIGPVCVATYQGLYSLLNTPDDNGQYPVEWYRKLRYVVFDEIHFLYSDALFNPICGQLLKKLPVIFAGVIRIYMSATPWEIFDYLFRAEKYVRSIAKTIALTPMENFIGANCGYAPSDYTIVRRFLYYRMDADYTPYRLRFFHDDSYEDDAEDDAFVLEDIPKNADHPLIREMNPLPSETNKWLVFIDKKSLGRKLKKQLTSKDISVAYIDSKTKTPKKAWETLIADNKVKESVLITTPVIQNGVNINDDNAKNIALFCIDQTTFIQELGRKRLKEGETVDLRVWIPSKKYWENMEKKIIWHLNIADILNSDNCQLSKRYAYAVRTLWDNPAKISYRSLFYVNHQGQFRANIYAMEILTRQLDFIQEFTRENDPCYFQSKVEEWLGIRAIEPASDTQDAEKITLDDLLKQNIDKPLSSDDFQPIRQAILHIALKKRIVYISPKRRDTAGATSLNPMLAELGLPYTVKKAKKVWTITSTASLTTE